MATIPRMAILRFRCADCGHEMRGATRPIDCPACGSRRLASADNRWRRTRRGRAAARLGRVQRDGPHMNALDSLVTTAVLIRAAERELLAEDAAEAITGEHRARFLDVVAALNSLARPPLYTFPVGRPEGTATGNDHSALRSTHEGPWQWLLSTIRRYGRHPG
jgi:DNA-directed RNA polymerase subunit RPC12/RpoP